jgi:non-specific serine/threonine protein kinase
MSSVPLAARAPTLPTPRTPLVGRTGEVARACTLLLDEAVPLLTLTGPGGVGKTRLALALAHAMDDAFADGVVFVDLAPLRDSGFVLAAVAQALRLREAGERPLAEVLAAFLKARQLLLVLDNCEQVLGAAPALATLLAACPALQLLATSRAPLRMRGEQLLPVPPLAQAEAIALFAQHARAADPDFTVTEENADLVAELCARLDGLPLALELAAVRLRLLSPRALLALLSDRLTLLTGGARDAPARQRTLRDTIAWSHDLLDPATQALFRWLAVFPGGFDLGSAVAVAGDHVVTILDGLGALVDQSLLRQAEGPDRTPRFEMLETVREYGLEQLEASGEAEAIRRQHAAFVLDLAEQQERTPSLREWRCWLDRAEAAQADLRAALAWALDQEIALALRLGAALWPFWLARAHLSEGRRWLERGLNRAADAPAPARLPALHGAFRLAAAQGDAECAIAYAEKSLTLATAVGDRLSMGRSLDHLSVVAMLQGDYERAHALLAESLAIAQECADKPGLASVWHGLGVIAGREGDYDQATSYSEAALAIYRELGDHVRVATVLQNLGAFADYGGDRAAAASRYAEALALFRELEVKVGIGRVLTSRGHFVARGGDGARATAYYVEALALHRDDGDRPSVAETLMGLGVVAAECGDAAQAVRLFGAATALGEVARYVLHPPIQTWHDATLTAARAALSHAQFTAAWDTGRAQSLEQAVSEALAFAASAGSTAPAPSAPAVRYGLSLREREVLRLVAQHLTDREIGKTLFISHRTAMTHVAHILTKLGVPSRREAAAIAAREGLV